MGVKDYIRRMFQLRTAFRACFLGAAAWCGWSESDQDEIGAEIRGHVEAGNEEALAWWAAYLEALAGWSHLATLCRAAEARIHATAIERRKEAA